MSLGNPFDVDGYWYRANLHTHTTLSDGDRSPADVVAWYRSQGYQVLALTDHNRLSETCLLAGDEFLLLGGIEVDGIDADSGLYHFVGLGPERPVACQPRQHVPAQAAIDSLRAAGASVLLAHPYWSAQMSAHLLPLSGCFGLEVYNAGCEVVNGKGLSVVHWDDLLAARRLLWGLATDDTHWWAGYPDAGLGWTWIRAPGLSREAVLAALEQGHFYASAGPQIRDFWLDGNQAHARCSPVTLIDFIGAGRHSRRVVAPPGSSITEAGAPLEEGQGYVRVACCDGAGRWAWSNPLFLP